MSSRRGIGDDRARLVEGADQVLGPRMVDRRPCRRPSCPPWPAASWAPAPSRRRACRWRRRSPATSPTTPPPNATTTTPSRPQARVRRSASCSRGERPRGLVALAVGDQHAREPCPASGAASPGGRRAATRRGCWRRRRSAAPRTAPAAAGPRRAARGRSRSGSPSRPARRDLDHGRRQNSTTQTLASASSARRPRGARAPAKRSSASRIALLQGGEPPLQRATAGRCGPHAGRAPPASICVRRSAACVAQRLEARPAPARPRAASRLVPAAAVLRAVRGAPRPAAGAPAAARPPVWSRSGDTRSRSSSV